MGTLYVICGFQTNTKMYLLFNISRHCRDGKRVTLSEFTDFLREEQLEVAEASPVAERMRNFLQDPGNLK